MYRRIAPFLCAYQREFLKLILLCASGISIIHHAELLHAEEQATTEPVGEDLPITEITIQGLPRNVTLFEFPGSAAIISEATIEERGISNFSELLDTIPDLQYSGGTSRPRFFQIRGIGELEQYEGVPNPSVGVIIDDIDVSGLGVYPSLFDVDQVEVLRGPQGIRYGSSALAGIVTLRSQDPTPYLDGHVELGAGNDNLWTAAAAVGGAVPGTHEKVQIRFSTAHLQSDGFRDNEFYGSDDTNERREHTSRLKIRVQPDSDLQIDLMLLAVNNDNGYDVFAIDNSFTTQSDRPGEDSLDSQAAALNVAARLSTEMTLSSISTIARTDQTYSYDGDWGNNPFWEPFAPYDYFSETDRTRNTLSQELRLIQEAPSYQHGESWRWLSGVYLQRLDEDADIEDSADGSVYRALDSDYRGETSALFGQVEIPLGLRTSLSVGARVENRSMEYRDSRPGHFSPDDTMGGGEVSLSHDISPSIRAYLTAARGFKGGGINPGTNVPDDLRVYAPEYVWNFETGIKGSLLDNQLTGELSVFQAYRDDAQLKFAFQNDPSDPLSFTYVTESKAEGTNRGVEGRVSYQVVPQLSLFGSGALLDTEYTQVPPENELLDGREQSHAPGWQYVVGSVYRFTDNWFLRVETTGKDEFYFDDSHDQRSTPYELLHASAGYRSSRWSWIFWARNILDKRYAVRGFYFGNEPPDFPGKEYVQLGDPLTFGTTVSIFF